ncbi:glutaredoxin family protein [Microbacterium sp. A93]|uniref:glutaredoxin family protein n=1 Tax=Microbacterium sp. A93 TaxID=3450716 RepID=UPI003F4442C8
MSDFQQHPVPGRPASGPAPRVELLVKDGCHLCADAVAVVDEVCGRHGVTWQAVDVARHPKLAERHAEEIPVLMVDGVQRDFWRIDPARLERLLTGGRA